MSQSVGPFPLVTGDQIVKLGIGDVAGYQWAVLHNDSPFGLIVTSSAENIWIRPWGSDVIDIGRTVNLRVSATLLDSGPNAPSSSLEVTVLEKGSPKPSGFPVVAPRQVGISAGTIVIGAGSASIGTVTIGAGSASIGTVILGAGSATIGTVNIGPTNTVVIGAGSATIGTVQIGSTNTVTITGQNVNVQNVSGTQILTQVPQTRLADISFTGAQTITTNYTLPAGTHAISILLMDAFSNWSSVIIQGGDSLFNYYGQNPTADGAQWYLFTIVALQEATWNVKITRTTASAATVRVVSVQDTEGVFAQTPGAGAMPVIALPQLLTQDAQFGTIKTVSFDTGTVANGGTVTLVAGVSGSRLYLTRFNWLVSTGTLGFWCQLRDTVPNTLFTFGNLAGQDHPDMLGIRTAVSAGFQFLNNTGGSIRVAGTIFYRVI